jgi:branched-chain amino acid transport system substrate-binding protein
MVAATFLCNVAHAQFTDGVVKIGVLTDMASVYDDNAGAGSVEVKHFGAMAKGMKVEIISADHQFCQAGGRVRHPHHGITQR